MFHALRSLGGSVSGIRFSLGSMRQWHWISSAVCLVGMLLFAATGITLNHAGQIEAQARVETLETQMPVQLQESMDVSKLNGGPVPLQIREWLSREHQLSIPSKAGEWFEGEVYLSLPRPGGDAWLSVDLHTGEVIYEKTTRGAVAFLNDLHKGRNTGTAWSWFIDIFSVACVIFSVTGLVLLYRHAGHRPSTWPLVGLGLVIPLLIVILTLH